MILYIKHMFLCIILVLLQLGIYIMGYSLGYCITYVSHDTYACTCIHLLIRNYLLSLCNVVMWEITIKKCCSCYDVVQNDWDKTTLQAHSPIAKNSHSNLTTHDVHVSTKSVKILSTYTITIIGEYNSYKLVLHVYTNLCTHLIIHSIIVIT